MRDDLRLQAATSILSTQMLLEVTTSSGTVLASGSSYVPGETLTLALSSLLASGNDFVFESNFDSFSDGCSYST
jgi:hypothetical protein